ncbi:nucleotidyltransferase domain-containing protein [Lederbergia wuyishanensis]|uniref:Nucleotidyltransferase n=1 Tax=Lederbergia wuyishanensis TaxID=1347903 RepID=A0ABU0D6D9_9BACI|nr:nucleotidyltransferase domain-containing protein [Lederbergia wuyishanensis]MCJ8008620.1 nucleotidyltransferase domain-containing protein [Lederbergia wuyishanensis]MDQ0343964.1 putative nucleotidyltransferase [Lederbergia wuyishanensis]
MERHHSELLESIMDVIKTKYSNDISLLFIYGSVVNGTANENSDLDMIFVPKTERGWNLATTFILKGSGNDLWGVNWERLESFANFDDMRVSILVNSRLVYYASEEDKERYEKLIKQIASIQNGPLTPKLIEKAHQHLINAKRHYAELFISNNLSAAGDIVIEISNTLCLLNHTFLHFGEKQLLKELSLLNRLPKGFMEVIHEVVAAKEYEQIQKTCFDLIHCVDSFFKTIKNEIIPPVSMFHFKGLYEELLSHWNKIRFSCEKGDAFSAFLAATNLQTELNYVQEQTGIHNPELNFIDYYDPDNLSSFALAANKAEETFVRILKESKIPIASFENVEDFKNMLMRLGDASSSSGSG